MHQDTNTFFSFWKQSNVRSIICTGRRKVSSHAGRQVLTGKQSFYNPCNSTIFSSSHSKNTKEYCILTTVSEEKKKIKRCSWLKFWLPPVRVLTLPSLKSWPKQHLTGHNLGQQQVFAYLKNCTTRPDLGEQTHFLSCIRPIIGRVEQPPFHLPHPRAKDQKCQMLILQLANAVDNAKEPWPSSSSSLSELQGAFTAI